MTNVLRAHYASDRDYTRQLDGPKIPRARRAYLAPDTAALAAAWPTGAEVMLADYEWQTGSPIGIALGTNAEAMTFTRPLSPGNPFAIRIEDYDWALYEKLLSWFLSGQALRLHVIGEHWIAGYLVAVPDVRILPATLEVVYRPTRGHRMTNDVDDNPSGLPYRTDSPFRSGSSAIYGVGSTTTFVLNDARFAEWIKVGDALNIDRAGTINSRTVTVVGPTIVTINTAVTGLAVGDQVSSPGYFAGVFT